MKPQSKKQKGSAYERDLAKMYVDYGIDSKATRMPLSGADEYLKGDIRHAHPEEIPFRFVDEAKHQKSLAVPEWWRQACSQCSSSEEPVLHFKGNYSESLTLIRTTTFFTLLASILEGKRDSGDVIAGKPDWDRTDGLNKIRAGMDMIKRGMKKIDCG